MGKIFPPRNEHLCRPFQKRDERLLTECRSPGGTFQEPVRIVYDRCPRCGGTYRRRDGNAVWCAHCGAVLRIESSEGGR